MNAGQAFDIVSDFVEADANSRDKVFKILKLACNFAWSKGKWWGMTAEFFCKVYREPSTGRKYIFSPVGYGTLLALNVNGKSPILRDAYFMFHKNGPGDIKSHTFCQWSKDTYDMGDEPTMHDINIYEPGGVMVGVRSVGTPGEDEYVTIQGTESDQPVFTYELKSDKSCNCITVTEEGDATRTVQGLRIKISDKFDFVDNVYFTDISKITKTITRCPIQVVIINKKNEAFITSTMQPYEVESKYRKYYVPDTCQETVHALFKISQQPTIIDDSQPLIISSEEALVSLCKGIHLKYYKEQLNAGTAFLTSGVITLEEELRETQSPIESPIQVVGLGVEDVPDIFKYH